MFTRSLSRTRSLRGCLIQAASIFFPAFDAPPWVMKIFIIVIIFGFPVALIFSWAFEITPEGIKLESEIEQSKSITRRTGRKIVASRSPWRSSRPVCLCIKWCVRDRSQRRDTQRRRSRQLAPNKSIAVLPFDNFSRDPQNAYFCEGVQDEILTRLAKIADLKVISRTSTQHFKSAPDNLPADREATRRRPHPRRQRAESERSGARECAADQRADRCASLGRHFRSQTD